MAVWYAPCCSPLELSIDPDLNAGPTHVVIRNYGFMSNQIQNLLSSLQSVVLNFSEHTVSEHQSHTPSREKRHFLYFNHLSKEFLVQMIPHLKALI